MGLEAVAGLPRRGRPVEELAPLPPSREREPLPVAPAAERAGRLQVSTVRPDAGIGLLGETPEEMNARLAREEAAEELLQYPGLARAVSLGQMTLPEAIKFQSSERARADKAVEESFEREETAYREQLGRRGLHREAVAEMGKEGIPPEEAGALAWDWVEAGVADDRIKALRAAREKKAEREAKAADLARKADAAARKERAGLEFIGGGALRRGEIGPQTQEAQAFQAGALTLPQAREATEKRMAPPKAKPKSAPISAGAWQIVGQFKKVEEKEQAEILDDLRLIAQGDPNEQSTIDAKDALRRIGEPGAPTPVPPAPPVPRASTGFGPVLFGR